MEHWFYIEGGKPRNVDSFSVEQMKQFLEEFGDKILRVGEEITKEVRLFDYTESLTHTFNYLKEWRIDFNKAHFEIGCEEDYDYSYNYLAVFYEAPAQESDVEDWLCKTFYERYAVHKASYDNYLFWRDKLEIAKTNAVH